MHSSLFAVRNLLSGLVDQVYTIPNSTVASIELCLPYARRSPIDEWQLVYIGDIDLISGEVTASSHKIIPWDTRRIDSVNV